MNVRAVRSAEGALELLGCSVTTGVSRGLTTCRMSAGPGRGTRLLSDRSPARGYGVVVAQTGELPTFAAHLRPPARREFPRPATGLHRRGRAGAAVARVGCGAAAACARWWRRGGDRQAAGRSLSTLRHTTSECSVACHGTPAVEMRPTRDAINQALDVERVTRRFFVELNGHFERVAAAVEARASRRGRRFAARCRSRGRRTSASRFGSSPRRCSATSCSGRDCWRATGAG